MEEMCHCGQPLHYTDPVIEQQVKRLIRRLGPDIAVEVEGKGKYLVPRHFIALHGLKAEEIEQHGFEKVG